MNASFVLVSHKLCPYVQRAAIVLAEKGLPFERRDIDLAAKPDWFLRISPLGKTPVLLVDGRPLFESAPICEYLDELAAPSLHPADAFERARERGWVEFGSATLQLIAGFYGAADATALDAKRVQLDAQFAQLERTLDARGPWFAGTRFGLVDAVFGPVFRYLDAFDRIGHFGWLDDRPRLAAWRLALAARPSVRDAVDAGYAERLRGFLRARGSALSETMRASESPALSG